MSVAGDVIRRSRAYIREFAKENTSILQRNIGFSRMHFRIVKHAPTSNIGF